MVTSNWFHCALLLRLSGHALAVAGQFFQALAFPLLEAVSNPAIHLLLQHATAFTANGYRGRGKWPWRMPS